MINVSQTLTTIMTTFSELVTFFTRSLGDVIEQTFDINLPQWQFFELSILETMIGAGVLLYIGYALISWIIDLLP